MTKNIVAALAVMAVITTTLNAQSMAGKWVGETVGPDGAMRPITLDLTIDGTKVTGTLTIGTASNPIEEGKIDEAKVSFSCIF